MAKQLIGAIGFISWLDGNHSVHAIAARVRVEKDIRSRSETLSEEEKSFHLVAAAFWTGVALRN